MAVTRPLEQVLADAREEAAILRKHGQEAVAPRPWRQEPTGKLSRASFRRFARRNVGKSTVRSCECREMNRFNGPDVGFPKSGKKGRRTLGSTQARSM